MIIHLRIDNRLIHGQVANTWIQSEDFDQVVACNDEAAESPLQSKLLLMAVRGVEAKVLTVEKGIKFFSKYPQMKAFVVVKNLKDAYELVSHTECRTINIGNQAKEGEAGQPVTNNVFLSEESLIYLIKILDEEHEVSCQMLPNSPKLDMREVLNK